MYFYLCLDDKIGFRQNNKSQLFKYSIAVLGEKKKILILQTISISGEPALKIKLKTRTKDVQNNSMHVSKHHHSFKD